MQTTIKISKTESQRGQALVEFALVLLFVILPFTFVIVDGAFTLFTYVEVTNAAREAARAAAIYQCKAPDCVIDPTDTRENQLAMVDAGRRSYVDTYFNSEDTRWLSALIGYPQCDLQIIYPDLVPDPVTGAYNIYREMNSLQLNLACPRRLLFGLVNTGEITLTASSTMQIEPGGVAP